MEQKVDGIILNTTGGNDEIISDLSKKVPMVLVNRTIETDFSGDIISNDNVPDIFLLTNLLINNGHTQIALLNGDKILSPAHERMHGFLYAMSKIQPDITEESPYIYHGNFFSSDSGEKGVEYFLNMPDPPTAIIALSDDLALGALRYFKKNNISIPNDISFCCYGKIPNNDLLSIDICQSYNTAEAFGLRISQLIMDRIKNPSSNNREIYSPASLYLGNSIKTIT